MASSANLSQNSSDKVLRHVVLFSFKPTSSVGDIHRVEQAFAALPSQIDEIIDFEWGTDVSIEGKAQDFTHCFFVTFRDAAGRDAYLPHPAHQAFGQLLRPHVEKVLVLDYWTHGAQHETEQETQATNIR
jgi:hypothetical protein